MKEKKKQQQQQQTKHLNVFILLFKICGYFIYINQKVYKTNKKIIQLNCDSYV
jgi:hypothetical protein